MANKPIPVEDEKIAFQGNIIEIVQQDHDVGGGKIVTFEKARRAPGTRLIFIKDGKVLLTKEHRIELDELDYRLPGGKVFNRLTEYNDFLSTGEDILIPAKKGAILEASEEVGILVEEDDLELFHTSICGATVDWTLFYFVARNFREDETGQTLEHGENIQPVWVTFDEAREICLSGKMQEDRSVGVLLRFLETERK